MIAKLKAIYEKYREQIHYMIFGGLTTAVNMIAYYFLMFIPWFSDNDSSESVFKGILDKGVGYLVANAIAFVVAVIFSYWANRNFVFKHKVSGFGAILGQFFVFFGTRVLSFVIEEILLFTAVEKIGIGEYVAKWPVAVIVVVINYAFGKLVVFRKPAAVEGEAGGDSGADEPDGKPADGFDGEARP